MIPNYKKCSFIKSAAALKQCPESVAEVAFVGRSNAGKSSAINHLTNSKIAKTSKTPGRTQLINFFECGEKLFLVDLPGYGYAKVPVSEKKKWQIFLNEYIKGRDPLVGLVIVMDIRHPLQAMDLMMLDYCAMAHLKTHLLLTKADKLSKNKQKATLLSVEKQVNSEYENVTVQLYSSLKKQGGDVLSSYLNNCFSTAISHYEAHLQ